MIRLSGLSLLLLLLLAHLKSVAQELPLIPIPNKVRSAAGYFNFTGETVLVADNAARPAAELLQQWLESCSGITHEISPLKRNNTAVTFNLTADTTERYLLRITKKGVLLQGGPAGLVRGTSTLLQLLWHAREGRLRCMTIEDEPVFTYRGVHLDVCRHFVPPSFVKRYLDLMALHKMNTFHWHLTEDQGWRIEIRKFPRLTEVGAWRNGSMIGAYRDQRYDSLRYGGFYTQDEIKDIVEYAAQRQITVIPEIEMPGHAVAALAAYPQYSCTGNVKEVAKGWGVFDDVFCVNDSTFAFLEGVLDEVMELFPSRYIHIGGDECPKVRWKACPKCNDTRYRNNLRDEHELQSYFIRRIEKYLNSRGRQIIGWDEILEGGLAPNATVMSWRGTEGGIAAARQKHDVVMTPGSHCYFDHYQGDKNTEPLAIGGYTPLEKVYAYRPVPPELLPGERKYILGAQANLWSEYMYDTSQVEYMLLPRLCALSEVLWTDTLRHDATAFYSRLLRHQQLLDTRRVNYSTSWMLPELKAQGGITLPSLRVTLESKFPQEVEYAWSSPEIKPVFVPYRQPLNITSTGTLLVRSYTGDKQRIQQFPFEITASTGAAAILSVPGDRNYNNPASVLCDGITGSYPWTGKQWIGWLGKDATIDIPLPSAQMVDSVVITYLHDPVSWIHAPAIFTLKTAGKELMTESVDRSQPIGRAVIKAGVTTDRISTGIISIGKNPEGTAGAGEDGWMFISEIQVY